MTLVAKREHRFKIDFIDGGYQIDMESGLVKSASSRVRVRGIGQRRLSAMAGQSYCTVLYYKYYNYE